MRESCNHLYTKFNFYCPIFYPTVLYLGSAAVIGLANIFLYYVYKNKKQWVYVGKLDEIYIFPMKACKPKSVTTAYFEKIGLTSGPFLDRGFSLIDET